MQHGSDKGDSVPVLKLLAAKMQRAGSELPGSPVPGALTLAFLPTCPTTHILPDSCLTFQRSGGIASPGSLSLSSLWVMTMPLFLVLALPSHLGELLAICLLLPFLG